MMTKSKGYAYNIVKAVQAADPALPGVQLALQCIERDIPVAHVAERIGVSRQTVYSWFVGQFSPQGNHREKVAALLASMSQ